MNEEFIKRCFDMHSDKMDELTESIKATNATLQEVFNVLNKFEANIDAIISDKIWRSE